ncbi:hypothetical protein QBC40DRAFT_272034 [Triangularia verruculosa]|uniref:DUF7587 domain-containing protein n=1 Tax=Triangularia verruculosa TaxID=2587418 RepID=A0AAN7B1I3_9PEZI|nr:hypothetical protein QBC40DRAFT_272034 [Triangularia verruculosa]
MEKDHRLLVDKYRHPHQQLPSNLYRIQYLTTNTIHQWDTGLQAVNTRTDIFGQSGNAAEDFKQAVCNQFNWRNKDPTPFISFFSDEGHAENWGLKLEEWGRSNRDMNDWYLLTIDTSTLKDVYFFKLSTLIDKLHLERRIPQEVQHAHKPGAYICLHRIPPGAIVEEARSKLQIIELTAWRDNTIVSWEEMMEESYDPTDHEPYDPTDHEPYDPTDDEFYDPTDHEPYDPTDHEPEELW